MAVAACLTVILSTAGAQTPDAHITVDAGQVVNHVTPLMYGSCIEDVNHEIYGGLYDQKIFGESFEEPPQAAKFAGWTAYGGDWRADGQGVQVSADAGGKLVRDGTDFADGTVEADIRPTVSRDSNGNAGLLVRVQNPATGADNFDGYEISLSAGVQQVILGKHRHDWQPLKGVSAAIASGQWHHLRVTLDGPRIRIYLDGDPIPRIDFTDGDRPLLTGRMALRTWNTDAGFRNVRIQAGPNTIAGPFQTVGGSEAVSGQWDAINTGSSASFLRDGSRSFNGTYCQRIQHGPGTGLAGVANRGLNRWGIAVKRGQGFAGRIYLRAERLQGPVTVALQSADGRRTYATHTIRRVEADWAKYPFTLTSNTTDTNARFAVWLDRPGTLWLDQAVLMGTGAERFHSLPIRADIAQALVREGVTFLRYAGTMVNVPGYRWKNMIGDPDRRQPYKGNWYPYSTNGFGIFDFLNFCEAAHIRAAFALNAEETAQDAADLADYLTAPTTTPWGRRRAQDGHPKPYDVAYIEIGNEENIPGTDPAGFAHYAERLRIVADAIHGRNPKLPLVCAAWWVPDSPAMKAVFDAADGRCAAWDLHVWSDGANAGTDVDRQLTQMQSLFQQWNPRTTLKCVIFEENGNRHDMQRALGHATTLNASQRHGDFVLADCPANCLQPWRQNENGWDQGQIFFTPSHVWAMPPFYAQQMTSQNHLPLRVESHGGPPLDVTATRSEDGRTLVLQVVNTGPIPRHASVALSHFPNVQQQAQAWTLSGDLNAVNPPDGPETIQPQASVLPVAETPFDYTFAAHSYTVLRLHR